MPIASMVGACFFALGVYVLMWTRSRARLAKEASSWPRVVGVIVESRVTRAGPHVDEFDFLSFLYRYEVGGVPYSGRTIDLFELESRITAEEMANLAEAYPVGRKVDVHYDADNPSRSAIQPSNLTAFKRVRNLGVVLASLGISLLLVAGNFR
jgi:Protein of unknown function (DUF3592)